MSGSGPLQRENRRLTWKLLGFAAGSFAFGFALVPLYRVLCEVTGFGDQKRLIEAVSATQAGSADLSRTVTVEFVSFAPAVGEEISIVGRLVSGLKVRLRTTAPL